MKKSISNSKKLNISRTSPLIVAVAIIEVILLICVSTFAWFVFSENNTVNTDVISVEPDSGLEIDFNNANENDYINIWNYLEEFQFEPVTSLDGRNLFIPTTGTFNAYAGDVSPDTPSSPENPGDTQNTYLIYFDTKGTGWNTPYIECDFTYHEGDNIAMTRLNSTSTIYYYDLAPLINKYNPAKLTFMKFKNGKGGNGIANITNMFGTKYECIYPTLSANYLYKCELDSNDQAIQGEQANHYGLKVLKPEPYSGTVPDIGGGGTGNSGSGEGSGAVADKGGIKFREATVNDMNSKYINIDFTLTNTGEEEMPVYLSSKSFFKLYDPVTEEEVNSKAIRIAFYQNDGSSGKVTSSLLSQEYQGEEPTDPPVVEPTEGPGESQSYFIYFDTTGSNWTSAYIECDYTVYEGVNRRMEMKPVEAGSKVYYIDLGELVEKYHTTNLTFMKFHHYSNDSGNSNMTVQKNTSDIGKDRVFSFKLNSSGKAYEGSENGYDGLLLNDPATYTGKVPDVGGSNSGNSGATVAPTQAPTTPDEEGKVTVYFNNTLGWKQPCAYIWRENGDKDEELSAWPGKPMTHISGSIYYYTFNSKYDSIIFNDGNSQGGAVKTGDIYPVKDGHIYMIASPTGGNNFGWAEEDYIGKVEGGTYPVISPGVSTGFQRPYAPVIQIDDNSGSSEVVIPAFASSIDDYNYGSNNPLFTIKSKQTMSLSMIVWLEGTDPDCTEDVYAGKDIDMNLIFATKDSGEDMYTYKFLDKTRENWIDDVIKTDTGVSFKPVIQLYDVDNQKGYMMSVHDDADGKPTIWQCNAPADLKESGHIMFRRVNPMKEEEVWNYWDTDGFKDTGAESVTTNSEGKESTTVYFSAFSDGAPTTAKNENGSNYTGAPAKSCGGLWGDHEVHAVTLFDGTNGQWIKNSDKDGTTSVITMNYLYKYPGGKTQTVEYKASGATDKGMYYFVVPYNVYSKNGTNHTSDNKITYKRYYNFDGKYALNSDKNKLTYHMSWDAGVCNGKFYEITEDANGNKWSYWGSDMLYVQAKNIAKSKMDNAFMQVHFYSSSSGSDSSNDFYTYLYKNSYYNPGDGGYGYGCVVPSSRRYYSYRVERVNPENHSDKWDVTPSQSITYESSTNNAHSNTVGKNICSIENFQITLFLQLSTNFCGSGNDPQCYAWDDIGSNGNNSKDGFEKAPTMTWHANQPSGYQQYKYVLDISRYNAVIFHNQQYGKNYKTGDIKGVGSVGTDRNGMIYQSTSSQSNYASLLKSNNNPMIMSGFKDNETMNAVLYEAEHWDINGIASSN